MRFGSSLLLVLAGLAASPVALAQSAEDKAQARALGERGATAFDNHDWAKAEDLFRRADALYHAPTLMLGLARAEVQLGKFVDAWEAYHRVILEGAKGNSIFAKAMTDAQAEISAVEGRRAQATLTVTGPDHATVTLDGVALAPAALGVERFVNPGPHKVHVEANGWAPLDTTFLVGEGQSVAVPLAPTAAPASSPAEGSTAPEHGHMPMQDAPGPAEQHASHVLSFVAFGVGGAGLVTGVVTGLLAGSKHSDLHSSSCSTGPCPSGDASTFDSNLNSFHTMATLSTVGFIVAGVGAASGVALWFLAPGKRAEQARNAAVVPYLGLGGVGAIGRF